LTFEAAGGTTAEVMEALGRTRSSVTVTELLATFGTSPEPPVHRAEGRLMVRVPSLVTLVRDNVYHTVEWTTVLPPQPVVPVT
jgi:hypothetical protein